MPNTLINRRILFAKDIKIDPIVSSFVATAGITDVWEQRGLNYLVTSIKDAKFWSKAKCIYPFVGGTSTSCSYNLVNTSSFQITWVNSPTFSSLGVQFNGTNNYGRTGFIPSAQLTLHDTALSVYSRTDLNNNGYAAGAVSSASSIFGVQLRNAGGLAGSHYSATNGLFVTVPDSLRLSTISKTASNSLKAFKLGVQVGATVTNCAGTFPTVEMYIGAVNSAGSPAQYWGGQLCFAGIFSGLTDNECADLDTIIENYQT